MSDIVSPLLQWLNANPHLAGLVTFIISAGESVAIIGTIVPGSIMMTALGTLAGAGVIPLWQTIFWAIIGAIVGDGISYWIGHYFKDRLPYVWPFRNYPNFLEKGEVFVHKYGVMSVFIGRFVGPVRALVPLVAGMLGMRPIPFTIANVTSAIGWAPAYMLPGILLGAASLELPPDIAIHVILVLLLIILFIMLCLWFIYKLFQLIHNQVNQLENAIWTGLRKTPYLSKMTTLLRHHDHKKTHGQLTLAFYFALTGVLFLALVSYVSYVGPANITVNQASYHFFRGLRTDSADTVMVTLTMLGQKEVVFFVMAILFSWLWISKRPRAALHLIALGILTAGGVYVLKSLLQSPRPWGIFKSSESFSMPSGHTTLSTVAFIGLALLIAYPIKAGRRWPIYKLAIIIVLLVSISRLYLGAHWFTDVLSSWLLSACLLIAVIISYHRQPETPARPLKIFLVAVLAFFLSFGVYHYFNFDKLKTNYSQANWPSAQITMNHWWAENDMLPAYQVSLFGFPSQQINIAWAGDLEQIKNTLLQEGWTKPPPRDWISTLHRLADVESGQYLPMVSPQYLDKKPALILTRRTKKDKNLLVLRLWESNRIISETNTPIWVGIVGNIPRSYSWLFKSSRPMSSKIDPALIFPTKVGIAEWEWKVLPMHKVSGKTGAQQNIMFIRPNKTVHKKK